MKNIIIRLLSFFILSLFGCEQNDSQPKMIYNQVGYFTNGPKVLYVAPEIKNVAFYDADGQLVLNVIPEDAKYWDFSDNSVKKVDFYKISDNGIYNVRLNNVLHTSIKISENPALEINKASLKAFYYNRSGTEITEEFGGKFARDAGHPDTIVYVHSSAATEDRPENTILSLPKGWYDAGDYNKYIVNSGITTYTLFRALEDFADYYSCMSIGMPDVQENVPEILTEILYNLDWFISMQDPNDGGVYHKLTTKNFERMVMPKYATSDRYVVVKSTSAALNYAALVAHAVGALKPYNNYLNYDLDQLLSKAVNAWNWAIINPARFYTQPNDIKTGAYGDKYLGDEWFWAASELYLATDDESYLDIAKQNYSKLDIPTWSNVGTLGVISLLDKKYSCDEEWFIKLKNDYEKLIDELVTLSQASAYGVSINNFVWGSNSQVANEGMLKLFAFKHTKNEDYLVSALSDLDYILGRNATGYCFVTGFGNQQVMNIHHRPSSADEIDEPVPGFLVGGPNTDVFSDCPGAKRSKKPALSFVDLECSYSTNEVAINWNAPLVYLSGGISANLLHISDIYFHSLF